MKYQYYVAVFSRNDYRYARYVRVADGGNIISELDFARDERQDTLTVLKFLSTEKKAIHEVATINECFYAEGVLLPLCIPVEFAVHLPDFLEEI